MTTYAIDIKFSDGTCRFSNVSESDFKNINLWMSGESDNSIIKFNYNDNIYYLNRDFFCYGAIKEESEKKKKKLFE